jgi:hypothetical protein
MRKVREIRNHLPRAAFLIGNGVNLSAGIMPSWKDLLTVLAGTSLHIQDEGLSNTEVYNLIEISSPFAGNFKKKVSDKLALDFSHNLEVHRRLMEYARATNSPVLTTNFDNALADSVGAEVIHINSKGFSRYYPWKTYYGFERHELPTDGFGIWQIHGDVKYPDSIRLGLTDYMGSVEKARKLIHNGDDSLFRGKRQNYWKGHQTWLHIWFNMPIIIFGFGFGIDEIFLRWLLIERKRYFNLYGDPMEIWYITKGVPPTGASSLLTHLGAEIVYVEEYDEIYGY